MTIKKRMGSKIVLYISEDYTTSRVHHNLCQNLANNGYSVMLFSVHREKYYTDLTSSYEQINYNRYIDEFNGNLKLYKYLFPYKLIYKYRKLVTAVNINDVGICHAATLFSDGAVALRLKKEKGIPFVVSVRGTDTDLYAKWMFHLWPMGREILREAERIVFISPSLREALFKSIPFRGLYDDLIKKTEIIPNGIDGIWLDSIRNIRQPIDIISPRILYIGVLDQNKNVLSLMKAVDKLTACHPNIKLSIVGGNGSQEKSIKRRCTRHPERYQMLGKIYNKEMLRDIIRANDIFAMVSHGETFGLVYVEALSQGLPVLFSRGRGIDGFFSEKVGEAVNPNSIRSISHGIESIISHQNEYEILGEKIKEFSWIRIAEKYCSLYHDIFKDRA